MASVAEKKRNRRTRTAIKATEVIEERRAGAPARGSTRVIDGAERHRYVRRETGLVLLLNNSKITEAQKIAGERYGKLYRMASLEDASRLKSGIDFSSNGGGGETKTFPGAYDYEAAAAAMKARFDIDLARTALFNHAGLVAALDVICGKGMDMRADHRRPKRG